MRRMLVFALMSLVATPVLAQEENDRDRKKRSSALYSEGLRAETERPVNLTLAISKYALAVKHAKDEKNDEVAAAALVHTGWCNERLDPPNVPGAKAAYDEVVSSYSGTKPWGDVAKEKASYKGVDVFLGQLFAQLDAWRVTADQSSLQLDDKKKAAADQILALKADAVPGLLWGLGHRDQVIRDFSADCLAQVSDEAGVTGVIGKLNDPNPLARAGAAQALQKIYQKFNDAADLDRRAGELERDLGTVTVPDDSRPAGQQKKLIEEASKLKAKATEIRGAIPATLATADIQGALQKILEDESAHPQARRAAAVAVRSIGRISGALVDALLKAMDSKDHNVREAACRAAGSVDTTISTDKIKLADRLIKSVQDEPAKSPDPSNADWANDEAVRQASAEALEQIALVKTLPSLIKALDDNDTRVRGAAFRALNQITRRDFDYGADDKGQTKTYEADKPLAERKQGQAKWEAWWKDTAGVVVLVERFWAFQSQWSQGSAARLFDPALLLKELDSKKWSLVDPKIDESRVKREIDEFQRKKDVFVQDAVDIGVPALDQLIKFIGGETEREPKPSPATRQFVAEAMAKIIEKNNATDAVAKLREAAAAGGPKGAGGCIALGFLPKSMVGAPEREALQVKGLGDASAEVKEAAANALAKVGDESSAADLTRAAGDSSQDVQIAALRALSNIHPKNADTVKTLGDMVADEPDKPGDPSKKVLTGGLKGDLIREYATTALGDIGDPSCVLALLRARRDTARNVREAATVAIQKLYKAEPKACVDTAVGILRDEKKNKTMDRAGAALFLGDTGDASMGRILVERVVDPNPPRVLRDSDSGVRMQVCEALGNLKAKTKSACEGLRKCMADEYEREAVRDAAYKALSAIFGLDPNPKAGTPEAEKLFNASNPKPARDAALQKWKEFLDGQGLKDEA